LQVGIDENIVPVEKLPRLLDGLLKKKPGSIVIIRADKDVDYENVENLIETIKTKTRANKIAVATKQKTVAAGDK
jgi:biopolymer transport protein ExbD